MAYATQQQAIDLYGEDALLVGCDRDRDGQLDDGLFDLFAEAASNEIEGYLIGRTGDTFPLSPVPPQIRLYCIDIAIHRSRPTADLLTEEVKDRYKAAIRYLEHVQKNKQRLVIPQEDGSSLGVVNQAVQAETVSSPDVWCEPRRFTRESMSGI